jgi:hypothetical protein
MRGQFNGLKDLIDAIQTITAAQVDAVNTVPPGDPAAVTLNVAGGTLQFTFHIPQGANGVDGINGSNGSDGGTGEPGPPGEPGVPGVPGEVTLQQLADAIDGHEQPTATCVTTLDFIPSDPPSQMEMQQVIDKVNELINALRR